MARAWCSEMTLQDLTVLASSRNTKINRTSLLFCQSRVGVTSCLVYKFMGLTFHDRVNTQLIYRFELARGIARRITKPKRFFLGSNLTGCSSLFIFYYFFRGEGSDFIILFMSYFVFLFFIIFFLSLGKWRKQCCLLIKRLIMPCVYLRIYSSLCCYRCYIYICLIHVKGINK